MLSFVHSLLYKEINKVSCAAYECGHTEDDESLEELSLAECVAAERRHNYRGNSRHGGQENVHRDAHLGQSDDVGKKILGCAWDKEQKCHECVTLFGVVKYRERVDLLARIERLDEFATELPHEQYRGDTSEHYSDKAHERAEPRAEDNACRDLDRFSGDKRDNDLNCAHTNEYQRSHEPMLCDKVLDLFYILSRKIVSQQYRADDSEDTYHGRRN